MESELSNRLKELERRIKLLFGLVVVLTVVLGFLLRSHFDRSNQVEIPDLITAKSIQAEQITANYIVALGSSGKNAVSIEATRDGFGCLAFRDLKGELKVGLLMTPSGKPSLDFFDNNTNGSRLSLGVFPADVSKDSEEEFSLEMRDANGKVIWKPNVKNPYYGKDVK